MVAMACFGKSSAAETFVPPASPRAIYNFNPGWKFIVSALPTFSIETGKPQGYAIALDDEPPQIVSLPASMDERNRQWQEDVMRNAALTSSVHTIAQPGLHTLKIWMVDPGIVLDTIFAGNGGAEDRGYIGPAETR